MYYFSYFCDQTHKKNQLKGNRISFDSLLEKGCMVGKAWQWEWEATVTLYRQDAESEDC